MQVCVLVAYLPVDKIGHDGLTKGEHSARYQCLFHEAMQTLLQPLITASKDGLEMTSVNGEV